MFPAPPDDGKRTVLCRNCDEWRHPRHACARDSSHDTAPLPVLRLHRDGPSIHGRYEGKSGGLNPEARRQHGIAKFDPRTHAKGPSSTFGATHPVYYLADEHDPEVVIERWIEFNKEQLASRDLAVENISRALSKDEFKRAWRALRERTDFEVLRKSDRDSSGGGQKELKECPFCGELISRLPTHLPCKGTTDGT